jgi:hypothetical protein
MSTNEGQLKPDQSAWSVDIFKTKLLRNERKFVRIKMSFCTLWCMLVTPVIRRLKQEDHELRPAWAT